MLTPQEKDELDGKPVCLFSRRGELLWRSSAWSRPGPRKDYQVLGTRFHEFINQRDLPKLLEWLANDDMDHFTFGALLPKNGTTARVTYEKIPCRGNWLCVGVVHIQPSNLPAPPCVIPENL